MSARVNDSMGAPKSASLPASRIPMPSLSESRP